jgi:hypothetical protein
MCVTVVVTDEQIYAVCKPYGLWFYWPLDATDQGQGYVAYGTSVLEMHGLDAMTPDEFESLVLPMVLEGAFCS